ncbi:hypothetical protein DPEC_G00312620 [Dallia pectoralis]|uniref:Uncharacterized protein n=1 Tax=Dallia pectoralis TaxID=75939 RepID=A0ACC2FBN2_DALPE|nr:hypothetical protein DPEC_G00312620 [Dallia pectoralis]
MGKIELEFVKLRLQTVYLPICINSLKVFLEREKRVVLRKVRPRVRLIQKAVSGGVKISCLAFGFYPRHINLTMFKDGKPIRDKDLTGGEVLPNGDLTYQLRKTLEISAQELTEKHNYTCTASHLSLANKLDISWDPDQGEVGESRLSLLVLLVILGTSLMCVLIWIKRKCSATSSKTQSHDSNVSEALEKISPSEESEN